ncbi:MAG: aminoacyl-tRNA hydrolase [Synechococcus sp. ELA057]
MELQLLVGLGNPGERYGDTRHNVGFMVLDELARRAGISFRNQSRLQGLLAEIGSGSQRMRLLKPQTFMNESGRSIRASLDWFGIEASQILVLVDDMDLPLGRLRLRAGGSAGGHNGLRSTISHLGTENFARLRIGIGAPSDDPQERRQRTVSHVLGRFSDQERPHLSQVLEEVITGIDLIRAQGLERAGNRLNSFRLEPQPS